MKFIEPKNVEECRQIINGLQQEIDGIDMQLRERSAVVVGRIPDDDWAEYKLWRAKAVNAKTLKSQQMRQYKQWIGKHARRPNSEVLEHFEANDPRLLVYKLAGMVGRACKDGFEPTAEDQMYIDAAKSYATGKDS